MTNEQLYIAIGIPMIFNAAITAGLVLYINAKFDGVNTRFEGINKRFDDMKDLWRAELHRVEEVIDARLKHVEGRAG